MSAPRVAVVGSINIDIAVRTSRIPQPGETLHGKSAALSLGGKGANQAVAARKLGAAVTFVGLTGTDGFADLARGELARFDVSLAHVGAVAEAGTGIATISIDAAGQNAILVVAGANGLVSPAHVAAAADDLSGARVLLLQCETPPEAAIAAARIVKAAGGLVVLDPAPVPAEGIHPDLIPLVDLVTPNETEARHLTGMAVDDAESAQSAADALIAQGYGAAIVKLGGRGLVYRGKTGGGFMPPIPVSVVDTVAAGDSFNGGLGVALAEGESLADALAFANACGALAVTKPGAADAAPTRAALDTFRSKTASGGK